MEPSESTRTVDDVDPCELCGRPWQAHGIYHDEPPADAQEGRLRIPFKGLYCVT